MPFLALIKHDGSSAERAAFRETVDPAIATNLIQGESAATHAIVIVGIDEPREMNLYREGTDFSPPFDVVVETDHADAEAFLAALEDSGLDRRAPPYAAYETDCVVKKNLVPGGVWAYGPVPGIRMLHPLRFYPDLPRSALLRSWREIHAALAVTAHSGSEIYQQRLALNNLRPSAADFAGFLEFQFPFTDALINGYFVWDEAKKDVRHDVRHFIDGVQPRLFGKAYQFLR